MKQAAFLRGINVGGHHKVPMKELRAAFEKMGCRNVKTLLASGNVVFEGEPKGIAEALEKEFGFKIGTIVMPFSEIQDIARSNPFRYVIVTPKTRLYVTFLQEKAVKRLVPGSETFRIIKIEGRAVYSVLDLEKAGTVDAMKVLEKEFGKNITTRNYNTIVRLAAL